MTYISDLLIYDLNDARRRYNALASIHTAALLNGEDVTDIRTDLLKVAVEIVGLQRLVKSHEVNAVYA